jgi:hypothetical protein
MKYLLHHTFNFYYLSSASSQLLYYQVHLFYKPAAACGQVISLFLIDVKRLVIIICEYGGMFIVIDYEDEVDWTGYKLRATN